MMRALHSWFACLVIPCAMFVATGCTNLAEHPLVKEATAEVQANARVADALGKPVTCERSVRGTANETDGIATLEFNAKGSKATGTVVVEGKKTRGEWGVVRLELRPAGGGDKLELTGDLVSRTGTDTPAFDPSAKPSTPSAPPPSDIEIQLPPGPPGQ
jgi:hypothetical protein